MSDVSNAEGTIQATPTATPAPASTAGQAVSTSGQSPQTPEEKPYFEYKWEDGKVDKFKTPAELAQEYRNGVMRRNVFTQKTQEIAAERKKYEAEQQKLKEAYERINGIESKWKPVDEFLRKRPDIAEYLVKQMKGPSPENTTKYVDERTEALKKEFEAFRNEYEGRIKKEQEEQKRQQIFSHMKSKYEDFDEESIASAISGLLDTAPGDEMHSLVDMLYWANKGRTTPAEAQRRVAESLQKKASMKAPMSSGGQVASGPQVYKNLQEAAEAAKQRYKD